MNREHFQLIFAAVFVSVVSVSYAGQSKAVQTKSGSVTGRRDGHASGTVSYGLGKASASGSAMGARGKTISGSASATYRNGKGTFNGSVTGPKGGTSTASGTVNQSNGVTNYSGSATGPRGKTGSTSGTVTNTNGSYSVAGSATGANGTTRSYGRTLGQGRTSTASRSRRAPRNP